jgi:hypothetical protein
MMTGKINICQGNATCKKLLDGVNPIYVSTPMTVLYNVAELALITECRMFL